MLRRMSFHRAVFLCLRGAWPAAREPVFPATTAASARVVHADHAVGDGRDGGVVGDDDHRRAALAAHVLEDAEDLLAGAVVEGSRGLVAQQDLRVLRDGAGDGHALLLAAGELRREVVHAVAQAHGGEYLDGVRGVVHDLGRELDVLLGREVRDQVIELENEADVGAAVVGELVRVVLGDVVAVDDDRALGGGVHAAEDVEQAGLARA